MFDVLMTARKRDRLTGERNRWVHGPYVSREFAERAAARMRRILRRKARVEVVPTRARGWGGWRLT